MGCGCGSKAKVMPVNQNNNRRLSPEQSFSIQNMDNMETKKVKYLGNQQSPFIVTGQVTGTHYKFAAPAANATVSQNQTQMIKIADLPAILSRKDRNGNKMFAIISDLTQDVITEIKAENQEEVKIEEVTEAVDFTAKEVVVSNDEQPKKRGRKAKEA